MKAIITVTGKDMAGIIAKVSAKCYENDVNILDISQSVLSEYFAMIMFVDLKDMKISFSEFIDMMDALGKENSLVIHTTREDLFHSMHRI